MPLNFLKRPELAPFLELALPTQLFLLNNGLMAGAEIAMSETKVSRIAQIVETPMWSVAASVRTQRRTAAVMTNMPEERSSPIIIFRRMGILTFHCKFQSQHCVVERHNRNIECLKVP